MHTPGIFYLTFFVESHTIFESKCLIFDQQIFDKSTVLDKQILIVSFRREKEPVVQLE